MGQTLTHGIYLPDEGERNCYNGLAGNWSVLDGAVGTIAEHTSQIAGKAPLVHTHTKADITDFPAYGNAAGTICEGNDSRLSDARTPVAHTHGKSDITDLFNSANTWTKNQVIASSNDQCYYVKDTVYELGQSYSSGERLAGLIIQDKNGSNAGLLDIVDRSYGNMEMRIRVQQKFDPNSNNRSTSGDILYNELILGISNTKTNYIGFNADLWGGNTYNLGTASNQWNNLYAKNYYYNGVAWGLDQANVWNTYQTIKGYYFGNEQSTNGRTCLYLTSNRDTVGQSGIYITKFRQNRAQGAMNPADLQYISFDVLENSIRTNGALQLNITDWNNDVPSGAILYSTLTNAQLGSSLAPWKTLNGINPGALSLPNFSNADPIDTRNWVASTPTNNAYTPSENGWLNVVVVDLSPSANEFSLYVKSTNFFASAVHKLADIDDSKGKVGLFIPVIAGITYYVVVKGNVSNVTISATLYPCFGSV